MKAALAAKEDRRTVRTKKCLADALKELILEKGYDEITVQDIIDRANVGRSTFYTHYESKEQLMLGNINFRQELVQAPQDDGENYPMGINIAYLFHHTRDHLPLVKAMSGNQSLNMLTNYFTDFCATRIMDHLKRQSSHRKKNQPLMRYKAEAAAGAIVRMLFKWLDDGAKVPADTMIGYSKRLLRNFFEEG